MIRRIQTFAVLAVAVSLCGCGVRSTPEATQSAAANGADADAALQPEATSIYSVADYGPQRDAAQDLAETVEQATVDGKRILLEIGGQW